MFLWDFGLVVFFRSAYDLLLSQTTDTPLMYVNVFGYNQFSPLIHIDGIYFSMAIHMRIEWQFIE